MTTRLAVLNALPFALDAPGDEALVCRIVAGKVAVLDESTAGVTALEVDDFELEGLLDLSLVVRCSS